MTYLDDLDYDDIRGDVIDDPVRAFADAVGVMRAAEFFDASREGLFRESLDGGKNSLDDFRRELLQFFNG